MPEGLYVLPTGGSEAKANVVAYELPAEKKSGRGRPPKKGKAIKLKDVFATRVADFQTATLTLYGKEEALQFLCLDLLWGQGLYQDRRLLGTYVLPFPFNRYVSLRAPIAPSEHGRSTAR